MKIIKSGFKIWKITLSILVTILGNFLFFCQADQEAAFIYDSAGKRDPFIPLIDSNSPTGLRTSFIPPVPELVLPQKIKIEGILWNGQQYFALANGQVVQKGDRLGKIEVKMIEKDRVILEFSEKEFIVFLREGKD